MTKAIKKDAAPQLPTTPLTEPGSPTPQPMDSEDEFMSDASSREEEDFEGTQDSDAGSIGEGKLSPSKSVADAMPVYKIT